jgi:arylsulfatase A-like enzyme
LLALALGLCGGYLDLVAIVYKKYFYNDLKYFWSGSDFPWSVPVVHALLLGLVGLFVVLVNRSRKRRISLRVAAWLFATLAIWSALLRLPLYGVCTLLLAAGVARPLSAEIESYLSRPRSARYAWAGLLSVLLVLAALSSGRLAINRYLAAKNLPAPAAGARNVLLIVWDTVRAPNLSLYGYGRTTTPNLSDWARQGVRYTLAMVPAPWTYPSHSTFFTGQWPYQLNSQWNYTLDATYPPTLAEYLASRGYETAGFAGNTRCCSYETGLDRGFSHYEDYPLTPVDLLARTVPGSWILKNVVARGDFYQGKWIELQSRDASGVNSAFLDWLARDRQNRPFFAFLNYYDAHDPYIPPPQFTGRFGFRPRTIADFQFLVDFRDVPKDATQIQNILMARDCYDDCIASLDDQLGRLLNELRGQGLLENTVVIITGDHGESFGDHSVFRHGSALYLDQISVPLVILSPDAPAGRTVTAPVSLRDLAATVVDQLGLEARSPFPGHSLAALWSSAPGQSQPEVTPALSELAHANAFEPQPKDKLSREGMQMSLVASGHHYIRDGTGSEQLYDLRRDPSELANLADSPEGQQALGPFRRILLGELTSSPGSIEVENAYLRPFRQWLESLVPASKPPVQPVASIERK